MIAIAGCRMKRNVIGPPGRSRRSRHRRSRFSKETPYQTAPRASRPAISTTATRACTIALFDGASRQSADHSCAHAIDNTRDVQHLCNTARDGVNQNRFGLFWIVAVKSPVKARFRADVAMSLELKDRKMPPASEDTELATGRVEAIRAFYESHPYPAPVASLDRLLERYRDPSRRRAQSLLLWPLEKPRPDRSILVAGCGTSQAARHALMEPRSARNRDRSQRDKLAPHA